MHLRKTRPFIALNLLVVSVLLIFSFSSFAQSGGTNVKSKSVQPGQTLKGKATFYPNQLNGHTTASGDTFHQTGHTAASNKLPIGTDVKVTNLENGQSTHATINDHGGGLGTRKIDLSKKAAGEIGITRRKGTAPVKIEVTGTRDGRQIPSQ